MRQSDGGSRVPGRRHETQTGRPHVQRHRRRHLSRHERGGAADHLRAADIRRPSATNSCPTARWVYLLSTTADIDNSIALESFEAEHLCFSVEYAEAAAGHASLIIIGAIDFNNQVIRHSYPYGLAAFLCALPAAWLAYNVRRALISRVARSGRGITYRRSTHRFGYWVTVVGQSGLSVATGLAAIWMLYRAFVG